MNKTTAKGPAPRPTDVPRDPLRYRNEGNRSLLSLLPAVAARILDVGCGAGDNARVLRDRGHLVWGVTRSADEAAAAGAFCEDVWIGDVETMAFPRDGPTFDAVILSHVLEHLVLPERTLRRLLPLLAPGGILLIAVPNMAFWRVRWQVARGDWRREETGFFDRTHIHFWSFDTAPQMLADTPFEAVRIVGADGSVPLRPLRRWLPGAAAAVDRAACRRWPNLAASQVLIVARPRVLNPSSSNDA